jgi:hypothetical protein
VMGKSARRERREAERVLRDVGVVYVSGFDGREVKLVGREADELRELMRAHCPLCAAGGSDSV